MLSFLRKRWFLVGLLIAIGGGLPLGFALPAGQLEQLRSRIGASQTGYVVAFVLFLMSFSLDGRKLRASLVAPAPVLWAVAINQAVIPLIAWPMSWIQGNDDFRLGLMIAATVPCTMAAASVWTRKAGGNDAVSLLVTVVTNGLCFIITPLWLQSFAAVELSGVVASVNLDTWRMVQRLIQSALIPIVLGQLARLIPALARGADRYKTPMGVWAQGAILLLVFGAACGAGPQLASGSGYEGGVQAIAVVWISCIVLHLAGMLIAVRGASAIGFSEDDRRAIAFAGSQKTLPIGVLLATDPQLFGSSGLPFAVFPMLMFHGSQLFIDTAVADRMADSAGDVRESSVVATERGS
ncbi:bile acid:sodium symporter [Maioricimonas sp. JC845]|uniref:bile acid:sodium symporter family protein n=1 Tax=Maioricimonas sp. JC845 TaxID=3232138 RepID=UPI003459A10A